MTNMSRSLMNVWKALTLALMPTGYAEFGGVYRWHTRLHVERHLPFLVQLNSDSGGPKLATSGSCKTLRSSSISASSSVSDNWDPILSQQKYTNNWIPRSSSHG